ncbi:MAG: 3'-5' exonuclease, partial [Anaerotignaceae bacterium]
FSQSLIQVSGAFVMKNPLQKRKNLKSITRDAGFSLGKITGYTETNAVNFLGDKLKDLPQKSEVLFLGRYRFDVRMLESNPDFSYKYNAVTGKTEVVYSKRKDLEITFMTVHSSKGLQADYVFILNNKGVGMGFPSQISDAPVLKLLLDNCDIYPFAEERRLFYVAITRAKKKVWLVTIERNQSAFVKEIEEAFSEEIAKERYTCPECGGRLLKKIGQYGDFYGCSNYKNLGCKYKRPIKKKVD